MPVPGGQGQSTKWGVSGQAQALAASLGLGLWKALRGSRGEDEEAGLEGGALINSLASNLWQPSVTPNTCQCERLMGKVKGHRPADLWAWPGLSS